MGGGKKGYKKGVRQNVTKEGAGGKQCPLPLFYPQLSDAVTKVRPFWDQLKESQRKSLLSADLDSVRQRAQELSKTLQKEAQIARDSSLIFDFEIKSYESVLDEALLRLNCKGSFKVWIGLNGEEFSNREEFQKYLEQKLEDEDYLCILKRVKQGDGTPEKDLQGRMEKLLRIIHEQISKFQQQLSKSSSMMCNGYRFPHLRLGCISNGFIGGGGGSVSESLHRKNKVLVRTILQALSKEKNLLFQSFINAIRDFTSRICEEDGVLDVEVEAPYKEFMEDMSMDDVGHLCEWLIEKIDCLASTKWKPSEQEVEEEEEEGDVLGDVDLFCLSEDGKYIHPNTKWLEHLMSRQIDSDGQPHKIDSHGAVDQKQLKDGLVLDWLYGSIVSTAEKARDAAQKPLGMDRPSLDIELVMLRRALGEMKYLYDQQENCQQVIFKLSDFDDRHNKAQFSDINDLKEILTDELKLQDIKLSLLYIMASVNMSTDGQKIDEQQTKHKKEAQQVKKWISVLKKQVASCVSGKLVNSAAVACSLAANYQQIFQSADPWFSSLDKIQILRNECENTNNLIKQEISRQEAVVSFFEFNLVNVACDDLGAVIGVEILLPMIQEQIEQQADKYFMQQAEQLQQQILDMEAQEKEEAARKKLRKKSKKKKKVVTLKEDIGGEDSNINQLEPYENELNEDKVQQVSKQSERVVSTTSVEQLVIEYLTHHENEISVSSNLNRVEDSSSQDIVLIEEGLSQITDTEVVTKHQHLSETKQQCTITPEFDSSSSQSQPEQQQWEQGNDISKTVAVDESSIFGSFLDGHSQEDLICRNHDNEYQNVGMIYDGSSEVGCTSFSFPPTTLTSKADSTPQYYGLDSHSDTGRASNEFVEQIQTIKSDNECLDNAQSYCSNSQIQDVSQAKCDGVTAYGSFSDLQTNNNTYNISQSQNYVQFPILKSVIPEQLHMQVDKTNKINLARSYQSLQDLVSIHQQSTSISRPSLESVQSFANSAGCQQQLIKTEQELNDACKQLTNAVIGLEGIKELLVCPLSGSLMREPVVATDGYTYDRTAIENWLLTQTTSPITNEQFHSLLLIPNRSIMGIIDEVQKLGLLGLVGLL